MSIADAVAGASDYLSAHPEDARYRDSGGVPHLDPGDHDTIEALAARAIEHRPVTESLARSVPLDLEVG